MSLVTKKVRSPLWSNRQMSHLFSSWNDYSHEHPRTTPYFVEFDRSKWCVEAGGRWILPPSWSQIPDLCITPRLFKHITREKWPEKSISSSLAGIRHSSLIFRDHTRTSFFHRIIRWLLTPWNALGKYHGAWPYFVSDLWCTHPCLWWSVAFHCRCCHCDLAVY